MAVKNEEGSGQDLFQTLETRIKNDKTSFPLIPYSIIESVCVLL
jgi:hypothetical protein